MCRCEIAYRIRRCVISGNKIHSRELLTLLDLQSASKLAPRFYAAGPLLFPASNAGVRSPDIT
jgi:hypothetical protein